MATIPPEGYALLNTIASTESPDYNVLYGGGTFNSYADHPHQYVAIKSGPNKGKFSSAAGKYQFLGKTWEEAKNALGLTDFSPESQDQAAWWLAQRDYEASTGNSLLPALQSQDPATLAGVGKALSGTWTSLPSGIEATTNTNKFANTYEKALGSTALDAINNIGTGSGGSAPQSAMYGVRLPPGQPKPTAADYQAVNSVPNRTAMSSMGVSPSQLPASGLGGLADPRMASLMAPARDIPTGGLVGQEATGQTMGTSQIERGPARPGLPAVAPYQNLPAPTPLQSPIPPASAPVAPTPAPPPNRSAPSPAPAQNTGTTASGKTVQLGVPIGRADSEGRMTYTTYGNVNGVAVPVDHVYPPIIDIAKESGNNTVAGSLIRGEFQKAAGDVQAGVSNTVNAAKDTVATNLGTARDNALGAIGNAGNFIGGLFGGGTPAVPATGIGSGIPTPAPKPNPSNSSMSYAGQDAGPPRTGLAAVSAPVPTGLSAVSKPTTTTSTIANPAYIDWQKTYGTGGANSTLLDIHDMRDDATMAAQQSAVIPPAPPKTITITKSAAAPKGLAAVAAPVAPPKPRYVDGLGGAATEMKRQDKARSDFTSGVAKSIF